MLSCLESSVPPGVSTKYLVVVIVSGNFCASFPFLFSYVSENFFSLVYFPPPANAIATARRDHIMDPRAAVVSALNC